MKVHYDHARSKLAKLDRAIREAIGSRWAEIDHLSLTQEEWNLYKEHDEERTSDDGGELMVGFLMPDGSMEWLPVEIEEA